MKMLAVSTSAKQPSAALLLDDGRVHMLIDESAKPHSVSLMPLVDKLLSENGFDAADMDLFAADIGPGSFTGVRIGVSAINAMAFAADKRIVPVSSLCALRHLAQRQSGTVLTMLDARNGNGYAAVFKNGECTLAPSPCVQKEMTDMLGGEYELVGDCMGRKDQCTAELIIREALSMIANDQSCMLASVVPLYLRPSQAERNLKG